jgi:hypothetical protein
VLSLLKTRSMSQMSLVVTREPEYFRNAPCRWRSWHANRSPIARAAGASRAFLHSLRRTIKGASLVQSLLRGLMVQMVA